MTYKYLSLWIAVLILMFSVVHCRKHLLTLDNDTRNCFRISTFGFWKGGRLQVQLNQLSFYSKLNPKLGLTLTKTVSASITPYMETQQNKCFLADDALTADGNIQIISFLLDLKNNKLLVNCSSLFPYLEIKSITESNLTVSDNEIVKPAHHSPDVGSMIKQKRSVDFDQNKESNPQDTESTKEDTKKEKKEPKVLDKVIDPLTDAPKAEDVTSTSVGGKTCSSFTIPFKSKIVGAKRKISDLQFSISMNGIESVGLYSLYFHNCPEADELPMPVNLSISIVENNGENYLSAGEMPLPKLYFLMSFTFFVAGCVWIAVLRKKREETFKIHYLMGLLVFLKSLSLLFHGDPDRLCSQYVSIKLIFVQVQPLICLSAFYMYHNWINYHIIAKEGYPMEAWAVLYYITHLLKGALLFITIVLIGTGFTFIKHILSDKDKKIFMIVIPLQVLANVAKIIMEESEEGNSQHYTWREIFILVDLICCGAILLPVVWSIRHLQEASQTDGKAAVNLEKLKLFRHFYVLIVCYIYFTRIIVYLLKITVPFQYEWLDEVCREAATFTFFIVTGINFQPTSTNPYFRLSQDDDLEMEEVLTQTGLTENVSKTVRSRDVSNQSEEGMATKRESSHEYD